MNRALTPAEVAVLDWLLDHAQVDATTYRACPLQELRVVGGCGCGCSSLDFEEDSGSAEIVADEFAVYPDGQQAGLILWGREGRILSLEVYDCSPESSCRFPSVSDLRTWDELGLRR